MDVKRRGFVTLGMFIIDRFEYLDQAGQATDRKDTLQVEDSLQPMHSSYTDLAALTLNKIGGGGTYAAIGARIWLEPSQLGMVVDRGPEFPPEFQSTLEHYGSDMWLFRDLPEGNETTKALNSYRGEHRAFKYLTPRTRITPRDLVATALERPKQIHFICSPERAGHIINEVDEINDWEPVTIYEPIPDRCIPAELPALKRILSRIDILSPNAEEALSLLSLPLPPTRESIENAAERFLSFGIGNSGKGSVIIRSGEMGAYARASVGEKGKWIEAFWQEGQVDKVVDVTGAGNAFLGGLGAGLILGGGNIPEAVLYATISASYIIEQMGLPRFDPERGFWNGDEPQARLEDLRRRVAAAGS